MNLFIRADADTKIGTGHLMRCLALAQAWQDQRGKVTFISHCESQSLRKRLIDEGMDFIAIENPHPDQSDLDRTMEILNEFSTRNSQNKTWLVIDGYHFDSAYQKKIKDEGYRLLWIDDYGQVDHYYADLVLNQNISADESLYNNREPYTRLLLGTRYVLLRREFKKWQGWKREIPVVARKVLVTLGGADPDNVSLKVIRALKQVEISGLEAKIIVGPANPNLQTLVQEIGDHSNLQIITNAANMPELIAWADVAISAGGSTCWEMAFMGLPNLVIVLAENQRSIAEVLSNVGAAINFGWHNMIAPQLIAKTIEEVLISTDRRTNMWRESKVIIDGIGTNRLIREINAGGISVWKATKKDCNLIWKWANDPIVRSSAFCPDYIPLEEHEKWFDTKLQNPGCFLFIGYDIMNKPIGQIRFDMIRDGVFEVDVSIDKDYRGKGYGLQLIKKGIDELIKLSNVIAIESFVKSDNHASKSVFKQAGFFFNGIKVVKGDEVSHFMWKR